ncbi:hypothetical protein HYN46_07390 [Aquirhabdus parva]|uniref:Bacterial HORMA domain-containing protein n=2 Tax=Aquirhabdus parva TaxID=2283318 RepID=A0A345P5V9_9GAMM|nr:hypothetical protein HYN46_07390 [Aquirhabdus parva]
MNKHTQTAVFHDEKWNMMLEHSTRTFGQGFNQYSSHAYTQPQTNIYVHDIHTPFATPRKEQSRWQALRLSIHARRKMKTIQAENVVDKTYPVQDVQYVVQRMIHDLKSIVNQQGIREMYELTDKKIEQYCHDIELLAEQGYLQYVDFSFLVPDSMSHVQQKYVERKAYRFELNTSSKKHLSMRPNGVCVSSKASDQPILRIVLKYTTAYTLAAQTDIENQLIASWQTSYSDISHQQLKADIDRDYSCNGYAIQRKIFS